MRRGKRQRGREGTKSSPRGVVVGIFHVRDLAPVNELLAAFHSRPKRKRSDARGNRGDRTISRKGSRARADEHGPLYLVDGDHLIFVAPSQASANAMRQAIERTLGDAVEHAETRSIKVPKAAERKVRKRGADRR